MTSQWAQWRLKSPASRLFTQPFIQTQTPPKNKSSVSLAFVWGIHRGPVNSPHKWQVTRKMSPFDDVIMSASTPSHHYHNTGLLTYGEKSKGVNKCLLGTFGREFGLDARSSLGDLFIYFSIYGVVCIQCNQWSSVDRDDMFLYVIALPLSDRKHQFLPEASFGLRVLSLPASVCVSVRPSVRPCCNHLLVRAITHHPFKLGSPNLDHRCKRSWLRSLLFWGVIDFDLQGKI